MTATTLLQRPSITVSDFRCSAAPGDAPFVERHRCHSISFVRKGSFGCESRGVKHYNASVQVTADGEARSRLVWIVDLLPNEIAPYIDAQMDQAALAMQKALGRNAASPT